jgi:flagellar biosynthesis protein
MGVCYFICKQKLQKRVHMSDDLAPLKQNAHLNAQNAHTSSPLDLSQKIAVALKYDGKSAPRVVAKGKGYVASAITNLAQENDITIKENALLAQTLMQVELDEHIPEELYRAVAEVITYVLRLKPELVPRR